MNLMIFIVIYVGAIAVLFLFVVMMLDLKTINLTKDTVKYFIPHNKTTFFG